MVTGSRVVVWDADDNAIFMGERKLTDAELIVFSPLMLHSRTVYADVTNLDSMSSAVRIGLIRN